MFGFRKRRRERRETIKQAIEINYDKHYKMLEDGEIDSSEFFVKTFLDLGLKYEEAKAIVMLNTENEDGKN